VPYTSGMDAPERDETVTKEEQGVGAIVATVIIVLLVAAAGIYFLIQENKRFHTPPVQEQLNA
jgi:uncharacterized protein HemX